jgi:hypothetical protein
VLYFSSSDNTSPLENGRQYKAITLRRWRGSG